MVHARRYAKIKCETPQAPPLKITCVVDLHLNPGNSKPRKLQTQETPNPGNSKPRKFQTQ